MLTFLLYVSVFSERRKPSVSNILREHRATDRVENHTRHETPLEVNMSFSHES
jgi:hypothetical protein